MIDCILWIFNVIVDVIVKLLPYLGGLSLTAILLVVSIPCLKKMISVPQIIKEHADALIGAVVIFILILPFTLWKSGYYGKDKLFDNSDTLGYYGALIGGGVTVLGVYWTLNYESKKSKEERKIERQKEEKQRKRERELLKEEREHDFQMRLEERKENSIPVFNFTIKINSESHDLDDYDYSIYDETLKDEFNHIDTNLAQLELSNTNLGEEESTLESELENAIGEPAEEIKEKLNKIQKKITGVKQELERTLAEKNISKLSLPFSLNINNIGLQSAILYSIIYVPEGPMSSLKEYCIEQDLCYLSVPKGEVTRINIFLENYLQKKDDFITEFKEAGSFLLKYTDLYRNKYYYNVPIKIKKVEEERPSIIPTDKYKIEIDKVNLPILPEVHNEMNILMSN
ncbi:hypothetical protein A6J79_10535 (plasmid) [Streptococcus equinus]|uniref:hypothetical protein n=1 Tax=Streptococcus salivarius TaxID=1304 RepID=UPI00093C9419|nr:hypothetical protein [Streptococcus salivarius]ARC34820.2 hypothetical protein A6J79_10535 [Streptococcus equinus]